MVNSLEQPEMDPCSRELTEQERHSLEAALYEAHLRHERMKNLSGEVLRSSDRVLVIDMTNGYGIFGQRNHTALQRLNPERLRLGMESETGRTTTAQLRGIGTQRATMAYKLGIQPEKVDIYDPWQPSTGYKLRTDPALVVLTGSPALLENGSEEDQVMTLRARTVLNEVMDRGVPFIGICYGMQLVCDAMGAEIFQVGGDDTTYCLSGPQVMEPTPFGQHHPLHHSVPPIAIAYHHQAVRVTPATDPRLRVLSTYPGTDTVTTAIVNGSHGTQGLVTQLHPEVGIPAFHLGAVADGASVEQTDQLMPYIKDVSNLSERFFIHAIEMIRTSKRM